MPEDSTAPVIDDPAPTADTPAPEPDDTGANTPSEQQPTVDWQARHKATQSELTKKSQALARVEGELEALRSQRPETSDETVEDETPRERALRERLATLEWDRTETVYGAEAVEAYRAAFEIAKRDPSPMGTLASYVAFAEAYRSDAAPAAPTAPTTAAAVTPRVDLNRSDATDLGSLDPDIEEATRQGDLGKFAKAATRLMGFSR